MAFDMTPIDYAGMTGLRGQPDPRVLAQQQQQIDIQQQQANQQRQQMMAQQAKAQQEAQQEQAYQASVQEVLKNPTPENFASVQLRFPKQADAIKAVFEQRDEATKDSDFKTSAQLYGLLQAGRTDDAKRIVQGRIDAAKAAGMQQDVEEDTVLLNTLNEDPKKAQGLLGLQMSAVRPDKFAAIQEQLRLSQGGGDGFTLGAGDIRYDAAGNVIASSPYRPQFMTDPETGKLIAVTAGNGTGPAGGFEAVMEGWLFPTEGGYAAKDGRSGAPVNFGINQKANPDIDVKNLTRDRAKQLYMDRYWKPSGADTITDPKLQAIQMDTAVNFGVDVAKGMLAQSSGDPQKYLDLREQRYRRIGGSDLPVWLKRNADLAAYTGGAGGGITVQALTGGKPPEAKPSRMSPEEVRAEGLDENVVYYRGKDGVPQAVSGQTKQTAAKQLSETVIKRLTPQIEIRDTMNRLAGAFQNDFGGNTWTGGLENTVQGLTGAGTPGQRDWWAEFKSMDNQVRNQLFGSALTEHEKKAYEDTTISPRMDPNEIKRNLARRRQIINSALQRQQTLLKSNRYDTDAVDALFQSFDPQATSPTRAAGGFRILRVRPKG